MSGHPPRPTILTRCGVRVSVSVLYAPPITGPAYHPGPADFPTGREWMHRSLPLSYCPPSPVFVSPNQKKAPPPVAEGKGLCRLTLHYSVGFTLSVDTFQE